MIRHARASDHPAIAAVVEAAFGQADEARLVGRLRSAEDRLFELVADADGQVVGHIMFSRLYADRSELITALAPLAVRPDRQGTGLGSALVRAGLDAARELAAGGVIVLGPPAYYPRFGFSADTAARVSGPAFTGQPSFMALALDEGIFDRPMLVAYPDAFSGG